ncbi:DsbA family protein [Paracoccus sp. TK19116]|uniref:DsbA family protein n=1 Tax=Paracoccus albicereus TaxID=2922394 RepID=A0ABT1MSL7_9RHOB|nr:DsbA family protein [Paracoccus albicereus]MCQ0969871.1 DsbA family protein [Paracoccus albicereus]
MKALIAALLLSAAPAMAFDIDAMSDDEKAAFGEAVREYLMANPEVLIESIGVLESRNAENAAENDKLLVSQFQDEIFSDDHSWVGGNPDGDLTVVEFIDYRCGVCRRFNQEVHDLVEADGNIRLVMKEFPILGQDSDSSARFAVAVKQEAGDEAYMKAHDALITLREPATLENLKAIAVDIGVDAEAVVAAMNTEAVSEVLRKNHQLAEKMAIQGTPTFVVGDELLRGVPQAGLTATVNEIRARQEG